MAKAKAAKASKKAPTKKGKDGKNASAKAGKQYKESAYERNLKDTYGRFNTDGYGNMIAGSITGYDKKAGKYKVKVSKSQKSGSIDDKVDSTPEHLKDIRSKVVSIDTIYDIMEARYNASDLGKVSQPATLRDMLKARFGKDFEKRYGELLKKDPSFGYKLIGPLWGLFGDSAFHHYDWMFGKKAVQKQNGIAMEGGKDRAQRLMILLHGSDTNGAASWRPTQKYINDRGGRAYVIFYDDYADVTKVSKQVLAEIISVQKKTGAEIYLFGHSHGGMVGQYIMKHGGWKHIKEFIPMTTIWSGYDTTRGDRSAVEWTMQEQHRKGHPIWKELGKAPPNTHVGLNTKYDIIIQGPCREAPKEVDTLWLNTGHMGEIRRSSVAKLMGDITYNLPSLVGDKLPAYDAYKTGQDVMYRKAA